MLREIGNRDLTELRVFLTAHASHMPRTMLRYAIEKLSAEERAEWLGKKAQAAKTT
jgi:3-methyladenine DNA glycosylase AlkD